MDLQPQTIDDDPELRIVDGPGNLSVGGHEMVVVPEIKDGLLQVQIANESDPGRNTSVVDTPSELEGFGVTENTVFEITVTVENYTPHTLFWALRDAEFDTKDLGNSTTKITIRGSPVELATTSAQQKRVGPMVDEDPAEVLWSSSTEDTAEATYNQTVIFSVYDLSTEPEVVQNRLTGMILTTNAQQISLPEVRDDRLRTWIAAPRFEQDGSKYEGFYQAKIPQGQLDEWGVNSAEHQLFAEYKSTDRELTVESVDDGISVDVSNISYSASYVDIRADSTAPIPNDTAPGNQTSVDSASPPAAGGSDSADRSGSGAGGSDGSTDGSGGSTSTNSGIGGAGGGDGDESSGSADTGSGIGGGGGAGESGGGDGASSSGTGGNSGGSSSGAVGVLLGSITAPVRWFGSLSTAGKAAVTVTSGAGAAGAVYSFGGDRVQSPVNMARRRLQSWLRRRLRGSTRQQISRLVTSLRKRLAWSNIRARLAALRKYFTRSYWREWVASRRDLATREGAKTYLVDTYRSYRKRQWRGWLRSRLRGGVDAASGGLVTTLIPGWLAPVSGPVGAALSVVVAEIQRWIEDIVMGKFDALGKRYSTLMLRSSALLTDTTDRLWYSLTGEPPQATESSVSSITGEHAAALRDVGIESVTQLAAADPSHLENVVAVGPAVIEEWVEQANRQGARLDRPLITKTANGRRVRQQVERVTARVNMVKTNVRARGAELAERGTRALPTRTAVARTRLCSDALPAVVLTARRARTAVRQQTSGQAERVRSSVRQLDTWITNQLGTTDVGLQSIHGVGPAYSERLSEAGLTTVDEVARGDPERIAVSIGVSPKRVYRWTAQARAAEWIGQRLRRQVAIWVIKTEMLVAALRDAEPAPLDATVTSQAWGSLDAPSEAALNRLSAVGIESVCQLAAADPDRLAAATNFDTERTTRWVKAARIYQRHVVSH
jgi:predicted flap endonuclease-1-like 5' DNA nuclease